MNSINTIYTLLRKDILLEIRQQYSFYGILLYVTSTIFVLYLSMGEPENEVWNGLYWVIQLFVCVNAVAKSFLQENKAKMLYFYTLAGPRDFILSKLLFNALLMFCMSFLSLGLFVLLMGNPLRQPLQFVSLALLGGVSISFVFTFLAAIASKAQQQAALMAILGFPIIIPQLLLLMKIANIAFSSVIQAGLGTMILLLIALDVMVIILSIILFPFLWKD